MKLGVTLPGGEVLEAGRRAREAEDLGASAVWSTEGAHNGFLPLAVAAEHTRRVRLGTAVAVAFGRSPLVFAHLAWDLHEVSGARFILGLGTQVKAHVERRYSMPWAAPGPRLRDGILAIRAIWRCWQERSPLDYRGPFYTFTLMTPAFSPEPLGTPPPRVYVSAVNRYNCRLVGELCDGMHVHPFHSPRDLRERVLPEIETGLKASRRSRSQVELVVPVFVITGRTAEERRAAREGVRRRLAFYASTRTYRPVLDTHGWGDLAERLHARSLAGDWAAMAAEITDEMVSAYAIEAGPDELGAALRQRYEGLADQVVPTFGGEHRWAPELFRAIAKAF
jgi:probable F420-dependent oxidoreductase